ATDLLHKSSLKAEAPPMQSSRNGQGSANPGPLRRPILGITAALAGAGVLALGLAGDNVKVFAQDAAQTVETPFGRAPLSFADVIEKVKPSVVSISVVAGGGKVAS